MSRRIRNEISINWKQFLKLKEKFEQEGDYVCLTNMMKLGKWEGVWKNEDWGLFVFGKYESFRFMYKCS